MSDDRGLDKDAAPEVSKLMREIIYALPERAGKDNYAADRLVVLHKNLRKKEENLFGEDALFNKDGELEVLDPTTIVAWGKLCGFKDQVHKYIQSPYDPRWRVQRRHLDRLQRVLEELKLIAVGPRRYDSDRSSWIPFLRYARHAIKQGIARLGVGDHSIIDSGHEAPDRLVLDDPRAEGRHLRATARFAESLIAKVQQDEFHERTADLEFLNRFLDSNGPNGTLQLFRWTLVTGPAGAGKTRLTIQFLDRAEKQKFHAGFLKLENLRQFDARAWRPSRPTFVVIDYAAESPDPVADMLKGFAATACKTGFEYPVRVLLLEREATGEWFKTITPTDSTGAIVRSFCYRENEKRWDYRLPPLSSNALLAIMRGRLPGGGAELPDGLLLDTLRRVDPSSGSDYWRSAARPLFAAATALKIADMMENGDDTTAVVSNLSPHSEEIELPLGRYARSSRGYPRLSYRAPASDVGIASISLSTTAQKWFDIPGIRSRLAKLHRKDVLAWIIDRERIHFWTDGSAPDRLMEKRRLRIHENLLVVATMALDIPRQKYDVECLDTAREYLPNWQTLDEDRFRRMACGDPKVALRRLEPDILGEFFVLDRLSRFPAREQQSLIDAGLGLGGEKSAAFLVRCAIDFGEEWRGLGFLRPSTPGPAMMAFARATVGCSGYLGKDRVNDVTATIAVLKELTDKQADPSLCKELGYALFGKGVILAELGHHDEALAIFDDLVSRYGMPSELALPELVAEALFNKAVMLGELGRADDELAVYDDFLSRYGTAEEPARREQVAQALFYRAVTVNKLGRRDEAIAIYDDLVSRYGTASEAALQAWIGTALFNKGGLLAESGRRDEAIAVWNGLISRYGTASDLTMREHVARAFVNKAFELGKLGRRDEAVAVYNELVSRYGMASELALRGLVAEGLFNKALILGELGRTDEELAAYANFVRRCGTAEELAARERVPQALFNSAVILGELGRSDEAITICDDLVSRYGAAEEPVPREVVARALFYRAVTLGELGRRDEAIAAYDDLIHRIGTAKDPALRDLVAKAIPKRYGNLGPNQMCPCGSGNPYQDCHGSLI